MMVKWRPNEALSEKQGFAQKMKNLSKRAKIWSDDIFRPKEAMF